MKTRRILALIFNMIGSGMTLLVFAICALIFLVATFTVGGGAAALAGLTLLSLALFGGLVALVILNIVHFVRYTKNQYHKFDGYTIGLGAMNVVGYIIVTILYFIGYTQNDLGYTSAQIASGYFFIIMSIFMCIASIVLAAISISKEKAEFPNV